VKRRGYCKQDSGKGLKNIDNRIEQLYMTSIFEEKPTPQASLHQGELA
jgi:hypothetical protein